MTFLFEILQEQDPKTDPWVYTATKHTRVWENLTGKLFGAIKRILNISVTRTQEPKKRNFEI